MSEIKSEKVRPKPHTVNSDSAKEIERAEKQFDAFSEQVTSLTLDRMNEAPKEELEPQTKISQKDIDNVPKIYLKPSKSVASREKFNERFRSAYEFDKEYVNFIAENNEVKGETMEFWTKPYAGMPAEFWQVPVNKPVWAPRYVAEQIKRKSYHRLQMSESGPQVGGDFGNKIAYHGQMVVQRTVQRLDAIPVSNRKSIFMGASGF